ncbi:MAG: helix-turn-helix transcriptional regulator [Planctomycetes bacterium]|nr:helix-turn-helix transcriptional regulator [Planctomycetota bacterium]
MKKMRFTDELRKAVKDSGLSQAEIRKGIEVDRGLLSRFLSGKGGVGFETLDRLAEFLDLHVSVGPKGQKRRS